MKRLAPALIAATAMAGCAAAPMAMAQPPAPMNGPHMMQMPPMSAIQPETTITLTGKGSVAHAPDIAIISVGVSVEAKTAAEAMQQQAAQMAGVFAAVKDAAARADLYAQALGYKVKRIVTISEQDYYPQPVPMMAMRMQDAGGAPETPIAAGEVSLEQTVSIVFELTK